MTNEDIIYIKYVYEKKDSALKPNVRRIVRCYNEVFKDKMKRPLSENICACNIRPYLIQLYREIEKTIIISSITKDKNENAKEENVKTENEVRTVENVKQSKSKKNVKPKTNKNKKKSHSDVTD